MKRKSFILCLILVIFSSQVIYAQLSAPGSSSSDETKYPVFQETDSIYIFCAENEIVEIGHLQASTQLVGTKTFNWEKYNNETAAFEFYFSENTEALTSEITGLANGCYRVTVTQGATTEISRAWIFNNWISASASITESNCDYFQLVGTFLSSGMKYYDLNDNSELDVFKDMKVQWKDGDDIVSAILTPQIFNPPTKDTDYEFRVFDKFGCDYSAQVRYVSIVTKASFDIDADFSEPGQQLGEAPLEVTFTNTSENGTPGSYEWFFFRNLDDIKKESENTQGEIDSILIVAYDENPIYTYENTGTYMVKLVSKKVSEFHTCVDTFYLDAPILVDSSFIDVPNVFTPNGDGVNDDFIVKFWSMQELRITLFNRWGRKVHFWKHDNIRGFENTYEETIWDGKIGNRYASPGVYYYHVTGMGRDGESRRTHGFFHLFRGKD